MSYVCLWSPDSPTGAALADKLAPLLPSILVHAPRIVIDSSRSRLWGDARGLHATTLAIKLLTVLRNGGITDTRAGAAFTPVAAEAAATWNDFMKANIPQRESEGHAIIHKEYALTVVHPGHDKFFMADFPLSTLYPLPSALTLLNGIGVSTCSQLATLDAQSIEVRLGPEGTRLRELACANDGRWIFDIPPRALPNASIEWSDYALRNAEHLLFVVNSLLSSVCATLSSQGERAREISISFSLANRSRHTIPLRSSRPTADQKRWLRLVRTKLENVTLPDAVMGMEICVGSVTGNDGSQGDLFDRGFASANVIETTLAQLADDQEAALVSPRASMHPLVGERTTWIKEEPSDYTSRGNLKTGTAGTCISDTPKLMLQILPAPREIAVDTGIRRDHTMPVRYRDSGRWYNFTEVAGPDRVSGGTWDAAYNREYFRCVREDGVLVWLFRELADDIAGSGKHSKNIWYLHGWWD